MRDIIDELATLAKRPDFVARNVTRMRAPLKERIVFTSAGRTVIHSAGERVLYGPNGAVLCKITENETHGVQVEEADRLHAVIRPQVVTARNHKE
jgi:hypothetical protein